MDRDNLGDLHVSLGDEFNEPRKLPTFAVGGVVRDTIREVEPSDVDLMVAEVSPEEMRERGFTEIDNSGNDTFAVFVDNEGREVAIAREEVSTGDGHRDFEVEPVPADVPASEAVERDLKRRDFTVNAMALDVRWHVLHDPHGGLQDLKDGVIRAVSRKSFKEDPLRALRAARFAARLGFEVADQTLSMMEQVGSDINELPGERLRMELTKNFAQAQSPRRFFDILQETGLLEVAFPEIHDMVGVPAGPEEFHGEGDTFEHTMRVVEEAHNIVENDVPLLLMALAHDIGKSRTPEEEWPSHPNHGQRGLDVLDDLNERLKFSNEQLRWMRNAARFHMQAHDIEDLRESTVLNLWESLNVEERVRFPLLLEADSLGKEPPTEADVLTLDRRLAAAKDAIDAWSGEDLKEQGHDPEEMGGKEFGDLLLQRRVEKMREIEQFWGDW